MKKHQQIYESKISTQKKFKKSFRLNEVEEKKFQKLLKSSGLNQTDFIKNSCLNNQIHAIPHASEIARTLAGLHNKTNSLNDDTVAQEIKNQISYLGMLITNQPIKPFFICNKIRK
ncbi:plasmid mobilization protein [Anaerosinus gibii]|uniref:Uncharacterized protein n=1 Tax=Selenobaculum gibii TaxID=3054208 RepID=A0A9Y2ERJ6_9FIRM|nr:hypothetical protein [Selenobaculum gbiensis]WIW69888.1 hypothetical protein P3F81_08140 [Selenobaculum gbiensis]